jgi:plasmid replication initiation protein
VLKILKSEHVEAQLEALTKRKYSVAKSNSLIQQTATNLSLNEQRFILIALSKIQKEDTIDKQYSISIEEFCNILNIEKTKGGYLHKRIKKYLKKLADTSIWYYDNQNKEDRLIRWLSNIKIKDSVIYYSFDSSISDYIYNLKEYYTTYELWNVLLLKTKNSIEFYEFIKSLANLQIAPSFEIDVLQAKFNVKYKTYGEFKRSFLTKCVEEVNDKTDLKVKVNEIKEGRKVVKLEFVINTLENKELMDKYVSVESAIQLKQNEPVLEHRVTF